MAAKIRDLGPANVSRHCADPKVLNVIDVGKSSLADPVAFVAAARADRRISNVLDEVKNNCVHLETPQPVSA